MEQYEQKSCDVALNARMWNEVVIQTENNPFQSDVFAPT